MSRKAFTLTEILVVVGVLAVLMVTMGGIMGMSFKAKNVTETNELMSSRAVFILGELKKNILEAEVDNITCPPLSVGTSISYESKDGVATSLVCEGGQIASQSANGNYDYLNSGIVAINCHDFVTCVLGTDSVISSVNFKLNLEVQSDGVGKTGIFYGVAAPRR